MGIIKLVIQRTITSTTATMNPHPAISSSILSSQATVNLRIPGFNNIVRGRSTLAKRGARLGLGEAHVKKPTTPPPTRNIKRKRLLMLSSSSFEERETHKLNSHSHYPSPPPPPPFVGEMGHKDDNQNDAALRPNGVVSSKPSPKLLTLPTVLTLARVAAVPLFISTYYSNSWWGAAATTSIFVGAAITDWLDGYLARKMSQGTAFGAFLDPVADKLMVAATLVLLCSRPPENALYGNYPWLLPVPAIAIIGREITMSAVREWAASQDAKLLQAVAVNNLGKWKTATQMTALTIILATRDSSVSSQGALATSGVSLLYISAGLAVWSLIVYMRKIWKVLLR